LNDALRCAITDKVRGLVALLLSHRAQVTEGVFAECAIAETLFFFKPHLLDHGWQHQFKTILGALPGIRGSTPLRTAASVGTLAGMKLLVARGASWGGSRASNIPVNTNADLMRLRWDRGADREIRTVDGLSAAD
ncbi:hypothetical protein F1880_003066, partial [Penicillium rolfsii]